MSLPAAPSAAARAAPRAQPSALAWAYAAVSLQTLIASATYLVAKGTLSEFQALHLAWLRITAAGALFAVFLAATKRPLLPPRAALPRVVLLGILGIPLNQGLFLVGLERTSPAHAAILYSLTPVLVLLGARVWLGERATALRAAGIAKAFAGVLLVLAGSTALPDTGPLQGDLFILCGVLSWAGYTVLGRALLREFGPVTVTGWAFLAGGALCLPLGLFAAPPPSALATVSQAGWGGFLWLVLGTSILAYLLWGVALRRLQASRAAVFTNLQPVLTAALAWVLLGDRLGPLELAGGVLVLAGVTVSQKG